MRTIATAVTPGGLGCLISWPAPSTATGWRLIAHAAAPRKYAGHQAGVGQVGPQHQPPAPRQAAIGEQQDDQRQQKELPGPQSGGQQAAAGPNGRSPWWKW